MAFTQILVIFCILAAFAEGYAGSFAGAGAGGAGAVAGGFGGFPGVGSFASAGGFPQWPFAGPVHFQQPINQGLFNFPTVGLPSLGSFSNLNSIPGGSVSGMTMTSTSSGGSGMIIFSTMENGVKRTFISDPSKPGSLKEITP